MSRSLPPWPKSLREDFKFIFTSPTRAIVAIGIVGIIASLIAAPLILLADFLWPLQLVRTWAQISALFWGVCLIAISILIKFSRLTRVLILVGAALLWGTLLDSIDGKQDVISFAVFAFAVWTLLFIGDTRAIIATDRRRSALFWIGSIIGVVATGLYLGGAVYYLALNIAQGPPDIDRNPLYIFGVIINTGLTSIQRYLHTAN